MTRYPMSVYTPAEPDEYGNYPSEEAMNEAHAATGVFNERLRELGHWVFADGLGPATAATVVDGQGAEPVFTDGPYLESKEYLGGFWIIEAPDLDVALKLAAEGSKPAAARSRCVPSRARDGRRRGDHPGAPRGVGPGRRRAHQAIRRPGPR
jgi:hypothetical protein